MCGCRGLQSSSGGVWGPLEVSYEGVNQQDEQCRLKFKYQGIVHQHAQTHLIRGLLVLRGGQLHGDGSLYILVSGPLPLTLTSDHMIVVDLALGVSGRLPVPGEV